MSELAPTHPFQQFCQFSQNNSSTTQALELASPINRSWSSPVYHYVITLCIFVAAFGALFKQLTANHILLSALLSLASWNLHHVNCAGGDFDGFDEAEWGRLPAAFAVQSAWLPRLRCVIPHQISGKFEHFSWESARIPRHTPLIHEYLHAKCIQFSSS